MNNLIDVSLNTMIAMLPSIINLNNKYVMENFSSIVKDDKILLDVSCSQITTYSGYFKNLFLGNSNLQNTLDEIKSNVDVSVNSINSSIDNIEQRFFNFSGKVDSSINDLNARITELEEHLINNVPNYYGSSNVLENKTPVNVNNSLIKSIADNKNQLERVKKSQKDMFEYVFADEYKNHNDNVIYLQNGDVVFFQTAINKTFLNEDFSETNTFKNSVTFMDTVCNFINKDILFKLTQYGNYFVLQNLKSNSFVTVKNDGTFELCYTNDIQKSTLFNIIPAQSLMNEGLKREVVNYSSCVILQPQYANHNEHEVNTYNLNRRDGNCVYLTDDFSKDSVWFVHKALKNK